MAALTNVYFIHSFDRRVPVVVVARDVPVGQQISRTDLSTARVAVDSTVLTIPAHQLAEVVGQRAAVGLRKGTLLAASEVSGQASPGPGQALVTVPLKAAEVPHGLAPGWQVRVIFTPGTTAGATPAAPGSAQGQDGGRGGTPAQEAGPSDVAAVVDHVGEPTTEGTVSVSLLVTEGDSAVIARQLAAGGVALVVTARRG
ncbi:SAF domain-containing protein [Actinomadura sp. SCN-SB]|uniref:SAF domain-containing protein n=1 Tax=Actinomadura sp. SCN-SB TaxID=3373092 RepID=UPI003752A488